MNNKIGFVALSAADACEFFERCIKKEAIKPEERMAVLKELTEEKRLLAAGEFDEKTSEVLGKFMEKTKHKGVIGIKKNG